jgi:hypothetical protein
VLHSDGLREEAIADEELWNRLARSRRFTLLCGYELDIFDPAAQAAVYPAPSAPEPNAPRATSFGRRLGETIAGPRPSEYRR